LGRAWGLKPRKQFQVTGYVDCVLVQKRIGILIWRGYSDKSGMVCAVSGNMSEVGAHSVGRGCARSWGIVGWPVCPKSPIRKWNPQKHPQTTPQQSLYLAAKVAGVLILGRSVTL
jgi:hypothetical protein